MKVAIYCRLSEEDKNKEPYGESASILNQRTMLTAYAKEKGWEIYNIYSDEDYAGADRKRPAFNRLISDAKENKFNIVLCKTQSRFTRELELVEKYINYLFPLWGIRFVSIVDNADTENKGNKKARQINGLVNEWYLEDMSDNIKSVLNSRRANGYHIGSFALYGYVKDKENKGKLIVDPEASKVVHRIFSLYSAGYGKSAIAEILNNEGIPNPTEYKRIKGIKYKQPCCHTATLWKGYTISSMLKNEMYIGNMVQGKYGSISYKTKINKPKPKNEWFIVKNTHEAIIEPELWEKVQNMLALKTKPCSKKPPGIFAYKVRCASCGYVLRSTKSHNKKYLMCPTRRISKANCKGAFISQEKLESCILSQLKELGKKYSNRELYERLTEISRLTREDVLSLIEYISVGNGETPIEIHWSF